MTDAPEDEDGADAQRGDSDAVITPDLLGESPFGGIFAQLGAATERLEAAADEVAHTVIEGSAAGGSVKIHITGGLEALSVHVDPELVTAGDVSMLEDAFLAALRDALTQLGELQHEVADVLPDGGFDLSSMLGNLGGLLGNFGGLGNLGDPTHLPGTGGLGGGLEALFGADSPFGALGLHGTDAHEHHEHEHDEHDDHEHDGHEHDGQASAGNGEGEA